MTDTRPAGYHLFLNALVEYMSANGWETNVSSLDTDAVYDMWEQGFNPAEVVEEIKP